MLQILIVLTVLLLYGATAYAGQGWYHMVPPLRAPGGGIDFGVPLREWNQMGAYDTAKDLRGKPGDIHQVYRKKRREGFH
jgi:hypothetical protein